MKVVSVLIICLLLIFVVRGEEDLTCEAGEGMPPTDIRTSGSQCSGLSKITTEAECKLAAEYNSKNNIDKNEGYGGRESSSDYPPGCFASTTSNHTHYYNFNKDLLALYDLNYDDVLLNIKMKSSN